MKMFKIVALSALFGASLGLQSMACPPKVPTPPKDSDSGAAAGTFSVADSILCPRNDGQPKPKPSDSTKNDV